MKFLNQVLQGDCLKLCKNIPDNYVDLIVTSPPYADARKWHYEGIHPNKYATWVLERTDQFVRILKPTGTFILNVKAGRLAENFGNS